MMADMHALMSSLLHPHLVRRVLATNAIPFEAAAGNARFVARTLCVA